MYPNDLLKYASYPNLEPFKSRPISKFNSRNSNNEVVEVLILKEMFVGEKLPRDYKC
jgi:hypothetical protein